MADQEAALPTAGPRDRPRFQDRPAIPKLRTR
nr:unnamed protein product [Callosobruchus analis]